MLRIFNQVYKYVTVFFKTIISIFFYCLVLAGNGGGALVGGGNCGKSRRGGITGTLLVALFDSLFTSGGAGTCGAFLCGIGGGPPDGIE